MSGDRPRAPFAHRLRVRYHECDAQGHVFNANYLSFVDVAITELWRVAIGSYDAMLAAGTDMVVAESRLRFRAPARFDEEIDVGLAVARLGTTGMTTDVEIARDGDVLVTGTVRHVFVAVDGWGKVPIPADVRAGLAPFTRASPGAAPEEDAVPADRLSPLEPPYADDVAEALRRLMAGREDVEPLRLFRTIAHHPALLERFRQTGSTLLSFGLLEATDRETVIHRATARCGAEYEWGVHAAAFAGPLGLGEEWLRATWSGTAADPAFTARQALLVRAVDELHDTGRLGDGLYAELSATWDAAQQVEIVCLAGFYHLVAFVCGAFAVEGEAWAAPAPVRHTAPGAGGTVPA